MVISRCVCLAVWLSVWSSLAVCLCPSKADDQVALAQLVGYVLVMGLILVGRQVQYQAGRLSGGLAVWMSVSVCLCLCLCLPVCLSVCAHQRLMTKWPYLSWSAMSGHSSGSGWLVGRFNAG